MMSHALPEEIRYYLAPHAQQQLIAILTELAPSSHALLLRCVHAAAVFDARPLAALLPLLGPTLRVLPPTNHRMLFERIASLAQAFPAVVVPLFRSLGRVYDEVGEERALEWIATGEEIARRGPDAGAAFFALKSRTSLLTLRGVLPHVYLSDVQGVLLKYLHMLSGAAIGLSETEHLSFPPPLASGEGEVAPLPFCIQRFSTYEENFRLYRVLVAHQIGRVEFGTYTCIPSRFWGALAPFLAELIRAETVPPDDLLSYFPLFPRPDLIRQLFLCIEGKRIAARLGSCYPGLQADLSWAESLTEFVPAEILAVLSYISDVTWTNLHSSGSSSDSLLLATKLYAQFLQQEKPLLSQAREFRPEDFENLEPGEMGFLTGVDLGKGSSATAESTEALAARRRRALTTADLRYVYDEWDFEIEDYRPHWCEVREFPLQGDEGAFFSKTVTRYADLIPHIKREFQRLRPRMYRQEKGLEDGEEIDLNAVVAAHVDRRNGVSASTKLYMAKQLTQRDVAVLFLLDLSASTATRLNTAASPDKQEGPRVIDLIKEAIVLLSVSLEEIGDAYAIYGFSSNGRHNVEVYPTKTFAESLSHEVQGRIGALTSQGSTRMGAAVRHATRRLKAIASRAKLLVVVSDGYPEDEEYGKPVVPPTYGLRDTLVAFREAERSGILSFCLTVDKGGRDYLREMCPSSRYMVIEDIMTLPTELPKIYQRYIWSQVH
jgi:nitric oxide reductase NorD protein